jgi:hypothetical protein
MVVKIQDLGKWIEELWGFGCGVLNKKAAVKNLLLEGGA